MTSDQALPAMERLEAFTDSLVEPREVRLVWRDPAPDNLRFEAFNGRMQNVRPAAAHTTRLRFRHPAEKPLSGVMVNSQPWTRFAGEWVALPGDIGTVTVTGRYAHP